MKRRKNKEARGTIAYYKKMRTDYAVGDCETVQDGSPNLWKLTSTDASMVPTTDWDRGRETDTAVLPHMVALVGGGARRALMGCDGAGVRAMGF